jgi:membrane-bound inhibitor of C-type lysozyme
MADPNYSDGKGEMTRSSAALALLIPLASCEAADRGPEPTGGIIGPVTFHCDDGSAILATFDNAPDPGTVLLVRGDRQFTLPHVLSGSGARYVGDDIEFWNKGRHAAVEWQGTTLECTTAE